MITVNAQIAPLYQPLIDSGRLAAIVQSVFHICDISDAELTLVITSDEAVRELNRQYRNIDTSTDVLSFETAPDADDFVLPPEGIPYLGDIIISAPTAIKQAGAAGHTPAEEVFLLAIHGALHLLGFDHLTSTEKAEMWQQQNTILRLNNLAHVTPTEQ